MGNQCSSQNGRVMQPRTSRLGGAQEKFLLERRDRSTNEPPTPDTAGTGTLVDRRLLAAERLLGTHSACPCLQRMDTRSEFLIPRSFQRYASSIQIGVIRNGRNKRAGDPVVNRGHLPRCFINAPRAEERSFITIATRETRRTLGHIPGNQCRMARARWDSVAQAIETG